MINSHREVVSAIQNFGSKMDFIKDTEYLTDINKSTERIMNLEHRGLLFGLTSMNHDDDYNTILKYGFSIIDKVNDSVNEVVTSEDENMFCVSALHDYINYVMDGDIDFETLTVNQEGSVNGVMTVVSGFFDITVKRTASYWKKLEDFDA